MKRHLSRKEFLSASISGGLGLIGYSCTLEDVQPDLDAGNSSSASSTSSTATSNVTSGTTGGPTVGTGGSGTSTSTSSTGSSGAGGSGTSGSGGSGAGGKGGTSGAGGAGGKGGAGGSGGAGGGGGKGGAGGSGGKAGGGGGGSKDAGAGGGGSKDGGGGMCSGSITANVSMNHAGMPHGLVIPMADIMAAVTKVYATTNVTGMGAQGHTHWVQVTAAEFMQLQAGMTVKKHSCSGGDHEYVLKCGGTTDMGGAPTCADECGGTMANACPT